MNYDQALSVIQAAGYPFRSLYRAPLPQLKENCIELSIVIPVYNSEDCLPKCLDSILQQKTSHNYEVICINDGSKDGSQDVLVQYAQKFNQLRIFQQENQGIAMARNAGIAQAFGEYIGFIDNDDYVVETYVEQLLEAAYKHNADIVQVGYDRVTPAGNVLFQYRQGDFCIEESNYPAYFGSLRGTIWGGCFRKSVFKDIRFADGFWYEDMINKLVLFSQTKKLVSINEALYFWVARPTSAMATYWKSYDIKSIDQLWLPLKFLEHSEHVMGVPVNEFSRLALLHEYSYMLYLRTHKLKRRWRKAVFTIARQELINHRVAQGGKYAPINYKHFWQWNLVCLCKFARTEIQKRFSFARGN